MKADCAYTHMRAHMYTHTHRHINLRTHTHIHTHTHAHTRTHTQHAHTHTHTIYKSPQYLIQLLCSTLYSLQSALVLHAHAHLSLRNTHHSLTTHNSSSTCKQNNMCLFRIHTASDPVPISSPALAPFPIAVVGSNATQFKCLHANGLGILDVAADGLCLFSAIIVSELHCGRVMIQTPSELLTETLVHLQNNHQLYSQYYCGVDMETAIETYLQSLNRGWRTPLGEVMLWSISGLMKRPILVFDVRLDTPQLILCPWVDEVAECNPIRIAYNGRDHFYGVKVLMKNPSGNIRQHRHSSLHSMAHSTAQLSTF
jgi:hypothetical protein